MSVNNDSVGFVYDLILLGSAAYVSSEVRYMRLLSYFRQLEGMGDLKTVLFSGNYRTTRWPKLVLTSWRDF